MARSASAETVMKLENARTQRGTKRKRRKARMSRPSSILKGNCLAENARQLRREDVQAAIIPNHKTGLGHLLLDGPLGGVAQGNFMG